MNGAIIFSDLTGPSQEVDHGPTTSIVDGLIQRKAAPAKPSNNLFGRGINSSFWPALKLAPERRRAIGPLLVSPGAILVIDPPLVRTERNPF